MSLLHELDDAKAVSVIAEGHTNTSTGKISEKPRRSSTLSTGENDDTKLSAVQTEAVTPPNDDSSTKKIDVEGSFTPPRTRVMRQKEKWQLFALCFALFLAGWDGGTYGPLIPRFQTFYNVNYAVVSLIFIANCIGFLLGAGMNVYLTDTFGFGKVLAMGSMAQAIAYALMAPALPFPVFCIAFLINGWGIAVQDAQSNSFVAGLTENSAAKMGIMHALYGFGAVCSPFAATQFAKMPQHWSYHFIVSVGLAVVNTVILLVIFKGQTQDECLCEIGEAATKRGTNDSSKYRQILKQKVLHLLALFSLVYVGVEITIGGWTVSYIQKHRGGGPSAGYISTGFFGGLTIGRVAFLWVNEKVGEHLVIYIYTLLAIGLELIVWLVPSLIADAVAVSLVGLVLGPMYPILMNESGRLIPQWLLTGSIGWIAAFGFSGSALFPFITGALAERFGIVSLQPVLIVLMVALFGIWLLVPNGSRRRG